VGPVSIIIPCYNAALTLAAAIESALCQEASHEIVVVDDGSTDETLAVARCYEPRIRVLTGPNRGVSAARNRGIAEAQGDWLLFLDGDDQLCAGTLGDRLAVAAARGADVVICNWRCFGEGVSGAGEGEERCVDWTALSSDAQVACATHVWAPPAAILYRRSTVDKVGGFRPDLPVIQDARFLFDAARSGARFAHAPHVGALYRISPGSLSRRQPARFWSDVLRNGWQIETLWRSDGELSKSQRAALAGIYDNAARGLFSAGDPLYFEAVAAQKAVGEPLSRHTRLAAPLSRAVGLGAARSLFAIIGRA
jgi:hypothetical protein